MSDGADEQQEGEDGNQQSPSSQGKHGPEARHEHSRPSEPVSHREGWSFYFEIAVTIATVLGALGLGCELYLTRESNRITRDSLDFTKKSAADSDTSVARSLAISEQSARAAERAAAAAERSAMGAERSSRDQLSVMTRQLERVDRPYLTVEVVSDGPVIVDGKPLASPYRNPARPAGGTTFIFKIVVSNDGRSPTTSAAVGTKMFVEPVSHDTLKMAAADACDTADLLRNSGSFTFIVRPFEILSINDSGYTLEDREILSKPKLFDGLEPHFYAPVLVGCIAYRIPYSSRPHFTQFVLDIRRNAPPGFFEFGVPVPQQEVVFRPRHGFLPEQN